MRDTTRRVMPSEDFAVIHPRNRPRTAWVNGRGFTRELLQGAGGAWRLSLAEIGQDAPFSSLPGRDRILVVAEGELLLRVGGDDRQLVSGEARVFRGESETSAAAVGDLAYVVNLMVMRGAAVCSGHGAHLQRRVEAPREESEVVVMLWRGFTEDGLFVEPGTLLLSSSHEMSASETRPAPALLRFPEPVLTYRFTIRSLA